MSCWPSSLCFKKEMMTGDLKKNTNHKRTLQKDTREWFLYPQLFVFLKIKNWRTHALHIKGPKKLKEEGQGFAQSRQSKCDRRWLPGERWGLGELVDDLYVLDLPWMLKDTVSYQESTSGGQRVDTTTGSKALFLSRFPKLPLWPSSKPWRKKDADVVI